MTGAASPDFRPTATWERLRKRAELLRRVREFFHDRGFLEVETPLLSRDTIVDLHIDPVPVTLFNDPRDPSCGPTFWLQTSPEFGMKRLLAAGGSALFQISRAFRGGESGPLHNPEFTMVEWYRVDDRAEQGMQFLGELASGLLDRPPAERLSYREAFQRYADVDPLTARIEQLANAARSLSVAIPASLEAETSAHDDEDDDEAIKNDWLNLILASSVEPHLGHPAPTLLYDYPASQAALATVRSGPPAVAERFELYVDGIELANGYHELTDADELLQRNLIHNRLRQRQGKPALPVSSRLLDAMRVGLPACSGTALGFDRLAMLACGATSIREVMCFPVELA